MSATCQACEAFNRNPLSGAYKAGCLDCAARSIAAGSAFHESMQKQAILPRYRAALERVFFGDVEGGHAAVKAWAEKLKGIAA